MPATENALALSAALTDRTHQPCLGLESGEADILELVTPTTAELLAWWFGDDRVAARGGHSGGLNCHAGQKQAVLNAIVAHEVLMPHRRRAFARRHAPAPGVQTIAKIRST